MYSAIGDRCDEIVDLEDALQVLVDALRSQGLTSILRVAFTRLDEPLQVVRLLVPGLESYEAHLPRVGPRLRDHVHRLD
jgi:ribosomal protein S12 methylthiotransferase accessory factor